MRSLVPAAAVLVLTLSTGQANAQSNDERARAHFEAGASYYESGRFEEALHEFEQSYALSGRVELFYNYSLCYERLGEFDQAVAFMHRYLHEAEDVEDREAMEERLESLQDRAERQREREGQPGPTGPPIPVPAIAAFAGAGATLIVTATMGGLALAERNAVRDECGTPVPTCSSSRVDKMDRLALVSDVFLGLTVAAAGAGVVLWLTGRHSDEPEQPADEGSQASVHVSPFGGRGGAGLTLSGSF